MSTDNRVQQYLLEKARLQGVVQGAEEGIRKIEPPRFEVGERWAAAIGRDGNLDLNGMKLSIAVVPEFIKYLRHWYEEDSE